MSGSPVTVSFTRINGWVGGWVVGGRVVGGRVVGGCVVGGWVVGGRVVGGWVVGGWVVATVGMMQKGVHELLTVNAHDSYTKSLPRLCSHVLILWKGYGMMTWYGFYIKANVCYIGRSNTATCTSSPSSHKLLLINILLCSNLYQLDL